MSLLLESAAKSSVILLFAFGLLRLLRGHSAALRHWILSVAMACAALAPVAGLVAPSWRVSVPVEWSELTHRATPAIASDPARVRPSSTSSDGSDHVEIAAPGARPFSPARWLLAIWIAGALAATATLLVGLWRLSRLASRSPRIDDRLWTERARAICAEDGVTRPVRLLRGAPSLLMTWGVLRPQVMVPDLALRWAHDRVSLVLYHELAHIRRGDWLAQLAAEAFRCVYWFNPLAWAACARLRRESDQACDDAVLNHGVDGTIYAKHLVEIACELNGRPVRVPAVAMARSSSLERRVVAMLDTRLNRRPVSRTAAAAAMLGVLAVTVPIAGLAAQQAFSPLTGTVSDPMNTVVPGVTLMLTNPQTDAKYEVRSDRTGRYEFLGALPGEYLFEAQLPGFTVLRGRVTLTGDAVQRDVILQLGTLVETITVTISRSGEPPAASAAVTPAAPPRREAAVCSSPAGVGGNIRAPRKLRHVAPEYPAAMRSQGIEGTVNLEARIGTDGSVEKVEVVSAPHADLAVAAADAVRQWQFDETLLNCVPVPIEMKVTVNFGLRP
jgi:TonB family protein